MGIIDDYLKNVPKVFIDFQPSAYYLEVWLPQVSTITGLSIEKLKEDDSWFWCYDDNLTPMQAYKEWLTAGKPKS